MALTKEQKIKLGQCLARLVPGFDGQILAYKDYLIEWKDSRPLPSEDEIIAEYEKILREENKERDAHEEKENVKKELKLLPPNADLSALIDAHNKLVMILGHAPRPNNGKPSNAVKAKLYIDGKKGR